MKEEFIQILVNNNSNAFNVAKLAEESSELATSCLQVLTKDNININNLTEELAHTLLRIDVIIKQYGIKENVLKEYNKKQQSLIKKYYDNSLGKKLTMR